MPFLWDFIANLAAGWTGELLSPLGMSGLAIAVLVVVAWTISWHRRQRAAKKAGMAAWQFIALAFTVAMIATAFGAYGLGVKFSEKPDAWAPSEKPSNSALKQPSYEEQIAAKTRKFNAPEKEGFAKALIAISSVYDQASTVSDLSNTEMHLWNVGMDNGRFAGTIPAHLERLKQLRTALDECDSAVEKVERDYRYYDEQMGYLTLRGQNPISDFRTAIDGASQTITVWAKIKNKEDSEMPLLLRGAFDRLGDGSAKFSGWIGNGRQRLVLLRTANQAGSQP